MNRNIYSSAIAFLFVSIVALACKKNGTGPESEPLELLLQPTHVSVYGGSDGSIDLNVTGGTIPYQYRWSNGATTEDIQNLIAGDYSVTVTDADHPLRGPEVHAPRLLFLARLAAISGEESGDTFCEMGFRLHVAARTSDPSTVPAPRPRGGLTPQRRRIGQVLETKRQAGANRAR